MKPLLHWSKLVGLLALGLCILVACTSLSNNPHAFDEEHLANGVDRGHWATLTDGFRFQEHETGIAFRVTPRLLTPDDLTLIESHINELSSQVTTELDSFRIDKWQTQFERTSRAAAVWHEHGHVLAAELEPLGLSTEEVFAMSCSLGATASPTTGGPGAKSYATGNCPPDVISGSVDTETTARAANDWPVPCRDTGLVSSQCSSTAYGATNCDSSAVAMYSVTLGDLTFISDQETDFNGSC